jgi:hypothetical protein
MFLLLIWNPSLANLYANKKPQALNEASFAHILLPFNGTPYRERYVRYKRSHFLYILELPQCCHM